ncbi:hypothetical protein F511_31970 [Dorcoceras hygrometricum]|uniref:Dystroglycan-like n=1 Tax=Dorcoceras hygrometricum TaxID=472368 RepID=A0A2Z7AZB3_9LAMI|nr:hypothetical protein F511_31970 [Dorcoceras hygrometricum]
MDASFYSNSLHVDFESVLAMGEPGMVSMFQAHIASGLQGFLGCPVVVYEDALVEFFANGTVRDGLVVSSVNGVVVEISEELFAETFDLLVVGLADVSKMPKDKIFDSRSIVSLTGEPVILSGSKIQMKMHNRLLCDIMAKSITVKAGSFNAITVEKFSLLTTVVCDVRMNWGSVLFGIFKKMVTPGTKQAKGFAIQISLLLDSVPNLELGESSEFPSSKILTDKTIQRYIAVIDKSDLIEKWAAERPVVTASDTDEEAATMDVDPAGEDQQVQEPVAQISNDDLFDDDEQKSLEDILLAIPVDVPLPSTGMEITKIVMGQEIKIPGVTEKTWFLSSLPTIPADHKGKAILVEKYPIKGNPAQEHFFLICVDIDLLVELRAKMIDEVAQFFHSFSLRKLATFNIADMYKKEEQVLSWGETESPQGSPGDRGAVIARTNTNTRSSCWIRTMIFVDGVSVEPCADKWVKIHRQVISNEVHRQRQYDDTLPTVSEFFRLMRKRWADVCLEVVEFCASRRPLPIGSLQFCRTAFRDEQRSFAQRVVLNVQFSLDQRPSSPTTTDSSSSLHFDASDVDAAVSSLPSISPDIAAALFDFQAILSEQVNASQSDISSRLHKIEQVLRDSLSDQAAIFKSLSQEARQEGRTMDDVQTLRFNEFRKNILAQNASIFVGLADVRC